MSDSKRKKLSKADKCKKECLEIQTYFYDRNDGTICGRTAKRWCLLLLFYLMFYGILAGFFCLMMYIFMSVYIKENSPYQTGYNSLLSGLAGLNVNPRLTYEDALIVIATNPAYSRSKAYETEANLFFKKAFDSDPNVSSSSTLAEYCPSNSDQPSDISKFCRYDKSQLGPCRDPVGQMKQGKLCVFIRVNKIYGWLPSVINTNITQNILINCEGQNTGDVVNLGEPKYYPSFQNGTTHYGVISSKYFPFITQKGYVSPMVAVQFPNMKKNVAILIQCQARNLKNFYKNVKFEVMVLDGVVI